MTNLLYWITYPDWVQPVRDASMVTGRSVLWDEGESERYVPLEHVSSSKKQVRSDDDVVGNNNTQSVSWSLQPAQSLFRYKRRQR
ncbi:hypothetical protein [Alteromonas sp. H39]|uniref:hypothetical protein n=1 Tax=Alteromonas sp. H39 TaxID=3389876 RepID=UPI0039DF720A